MPLPGFGLFFAQSGGGPRSQKPAKSGPEPTAPEHVEEDHDRRREVNAVMNDVMPWMVSLLFHLGIIILAFFLVWATVSQVDEEDVIVPTLSLGDTPGTPLNLTTPQQVTEESSSSRRTQTKTLVRTTSTVESQEQTPTQEYGIAGAQEAMASPFGTGPRPGEGFDVGFFGTGGNARNIVWVIDASGSMIDTIPFVVDELKRSIAQLSEQQRFNVIFYQNGQAVEARLPRRGMKTGTSENKQAVIDWIDLAAGNVVPGGQTDPTPAVQMALRFEPDLVYLLSDNVIGARRYGLEPDKLVDEITKMNNNTKPSVINCIQFFYRDPLEQFGKKPTLERISEATGGEYRFVDGRSLEGR